MHIKYLGVKGHYVFKLRSDGSGKKNVFIQRWSYKANVKKKGEQSQSRRTRKNSVKFLGLFPKFEIIILILYYLYVIYLKLLL